MTFAVGSRVVLRRFRVTDAPALVAYRADPEVARYQSWEPMDLAAAEGMAAAMAERHPLLRPGHWTQVALADPRTDALIGDMGLFLSETGAEAEMGITLSRAAQGRGCAQEAVGLARDLIFRATSAGVIWGIADARNAASLALIARSGFVFNHEEVTDGVTERVFRLDRPAALLSEGFVQ